MRLTITHVRRWLEYRKRVGTGSIYQGRFKSFAVEADEHLYALLRYVERNALRAKLVKKAQAWRWSSLWRRTSGTAEQQAMLTPPPIDLTKDWARRVNQPESAKELAALRTSVTRGRPLGDADWARRTAKRLGLPEKLRGRGRPKKKDNGAERK